jgi:hypothetical protein
MLASHFIWTQIENNYGEFLLARLGSILVVLDWVS